MGGRESEFLFPSFLLLLSFFSLLHFSMLLDRERETERGRKRTELERILLAFLLLHQTYKERVLKKEEINRTSSSSFSLSYWNH
jgi:hypothetical protein